MASTIEIIALGARTPVGLSAAGTAAAIRARICRLGGHPYYSDGVSEPLTCGRDSQIDEGLCGVPRLTALATYALREVSQQLAGACAGSTRVPVFLALPEVRPGFTLADAARLSQALSVMSGSGSCALEVKPITEGHAGGVRALQLACAHVLEGFADICIAGGVDSYLEPATLAWLESERRLACDGVRTGFPPGESAAMIAVTRSSHRAGANLRALARLREIACAKEMRTIDSQEGPLGEGLTAAVRGATRSLRSGEQISDVYGDINGERHRTEEWGFTLLRCPELFRDGTEYVSTIAECGDLGAATALLNCVLAVRSWQRAYAKGPLALVWASSWQGLRGAALLERTEN